MKFYLATQKQENARPVRDALVALGHTCTATWLDLAGYASIPSDDAQRAKAATTCQREVVEADVLILIAEPDGSLVRGGKHVETGMAMAWGKRVYVLGKRENVFHWHPNVTVCETLEELKAMVSP
jgi:nucleoside 2-deoxyribosyltransferase